MAYRRKATNHVREVKSFSLNITSMTDMFTILLVFLLQTYSTNEFQLTPEKDMRLPISSSQTNPVKSLEIRVSASELKVNDQSVAHLNQGSFRAEDLQKEDSLFIKPLFETLKAVPNNEDGKALLLADEALTYDVLKKVFYTASMAGYPKVRLATMAGN